MRRTWNDDMIERLASHLVATFVASGEMSTPYTGSTPSALDRLSVALRIPRRHSVIFQPAYDPPAI